MNFKNDYERLAFYEAKMKYYGAKLNIIEGGTLQTQALHQAEIVKLTQELNTKNTELENINKQIKESTEQKETIKREIKNIYAKIKATDKLLKDDIKTTGNTTQSPPVQVATPPVQVATQPVQVATQPVQVATQPVKTKRWSMTGK